ncbi:MAG: FesM, partial [Chloroflexi bacterium]|nr:FesM [Chloroflexota bacterium]
LALTYSAAWLSKTLVASPLSLNRLVMRYAYGFVPLGFAIWSAHYLFHLLTGFMTIIPAFQTFFAKTLGWALLGEPNWELARHFVPTVDAIQITQTTIIYVGLLMALALTLNSARKTHRDRGKVLLEALPWLILVFLIIFTSGAIFLLPMEMRGSALGG